MKVIGLAGPAGSGKSAVARELARRPATRWIDLDEVAWTTYARGTPTYHALLVRFGLEILGPDGHVDRTALAARAFADPQSQRDLNRIVHPAVSEALARRIAEAREAGCAALLVEGALLAHSPDVDRTLFDCILWFEAPDATRHERLSRAGRLHHAARNAELRCPPGAVCLATDASLGEVVERASRAIEEARPR